MYYLLTIEIYLTRDLTKIQLKKRFQKSPLLHSRMKIPQIDSGNPRTEMKNGGAITLCAHTLLLAQPNKTRETYDTEF